ncbi:hypothetical protein LZ31DRAFT_343982 [Colletotrichum somersetense]|nr:hypothetical protein LZ31DRAFT_343982 [Colletotrichum somersetense]
MRVSYIIFGNSWSCLRFFVASFPPPRSLDLTPIYPPPNSPSTQLVALLERDGADPTTHHRQYISYSAYFPILISLVSSSLAGPFIRSTALIHPAHARVNDRDDDANKRRRQRRSCSAYFQSLIRKGRCHPCFPPSRPASSTAVTYYYYYYYYYYYCHCLHERHHYLHTII